ncbi:unnamed protein product, partial [marine sediment metagenome]
QATITYLLQESGFNIVRVLGAPTLRYNLPVLGKWTWRKDRWWIYRLFDTLLGAFPPLNEWGAIQLFVCTKKEGGK